MRQLLLFSLTLLAASPAFAMDYNVSATGRCVYRENGVVKPIPYAEVELRDQDFGIPIEGDVVGPMALDLSGNDLCGRGATDAQGKFSIAGRCGDPGPCLFGKCPSWTPPDLYVRCSLKGRAGRVFQNAFPWTLYNATTRPRADNAAPLAAGDIELPAGAAKTFISMTYTYDKINALLGTWLLDVWTIYPGGHEATVLNTDQTYFASYAGTLFMSIAAGDEDNGTVGHEYHHTLQFQAFLHDWSRIQYAVNLIKAGYEFVRNSSGQGHTLSTLSNPVMAFSEGFAEFGEGVVYGGGLPNCATWREIGATEADKISVEGNVACRLFRLYQRYGYKDVWTALTRSKAARYDDWFKEYVKLHADAAAVATPAARVIAAVAPLVAAGTLLPTTRLRASAPLQGTPVERIVAPTQRAATFARSLGVQSSLTAGLLAGSLLAAEGPACQLTRDAYALQQRYVAAGCANPAGDDVKQECALKGQALGSRATALTAFCPQVLQRLPRPQDLRFVPQELSSPRALLVPGMFPGRALPLPIVPMVRTLPALR